VIDSRILLDFDPKFDFFRNRLFIEMRQNTYVNPSMYSGQQIFDFDNPKFENLPFDLAKFLRPEDTNFTMVILLNSVNFEFSAKVLSSK